MPLFGSPNIEKLKAQGNVNGLIKALDYKKDVTVRMTAAKELGQIGDTRAVVPIITALGDKNLSVRKVAIEAHVAKPRLEQVRSPIDRFFDDEMVDE